MCIYKPPKLSGWHWLKWIGAEPLQSHPRLSQLGWILVGKWTSKSCTDALRDVQAYKNVVPHHGNLISHSSTLSVMSKNTSGL